MAMKIKETIVVEGRDDTAAIRRSVDALTIETHGYGIRSDTWEILAKAYRSTGIIIFTDPDHAGEQIRRRLLERFPDAKEAFLDIDSATADNGDIGIENASDEAIQAALTKLYGSAHTMDMSEPSPGEGRDTRVEPVTKKDLFEMGLVGTENAAKRRQALGASMGIGFATAKTFLNRLNKFGISREEIEAALRKI